MGKTLIPVSSYGISESYLEKGPIFVDDKHTSFVKGEPVFVEDMQNDPRVQYPEAGAKEGIVSMLSIPIQFRAVPIGLIRIYYGKKTGIHKDDVESLLVMSALLTAWQCWWPNPCEAAV